MPESDIQTLDRATVKTLAKELGECRLVSTRAFMALIPAIARFKIYVDEGCQDLYAYCAKVAGLTRDEVNRVLALYRRIGQHPCLWGLLMRGEAGLSKLERAAPFVTEANAAWLADKVQALPKSQLEELLRGLGSKRAQQRVEASAHPAVAEPSPSTSSAESVPSGGIFSSEQPPFVSEPVAAPVAQAPSRPEPAIESGAEYETDADPCDQRLRLSLEVDPLGEKRIRELQEVYQRTQGRPVGLGELFALLATEALDRGSIPGAELAAEESSQVAGPSNESVARRISQKSFVVRMLEVVVSIAETGWTFVRTAAGWLPFKGAALGGFLSPGQPVPLANLRIAAIESAKDAIGRHVPVAVERYIWARSGGYCEVRDCHRRASELHHRKRFALVPSHHPDDVFAICEIHHENPHFGLVVNEEDDPADWDTIQEGKERVARAIDAKFQRLRAPSVNWGNQP